MSQGGDIDYSTMLRVFSLMALHAVQGIIHVYFTAPWPKLFNFAYTNVWRLSTPVKICLYISRSGILSVASSKTE